MTLEKIANEDLTINFVNNAGPGDLTYSSDKTITYPGVNEQLDTKVKCNGKFVAQNLIGLSWNVAGFPCPHTSASHTFVSGSGTILATATKVKLPLLKVMRENDDSVAPGSPGCVGSWTDPGPPPVAVPCQCDILIKTAGQNKVKAE